MSRLFLSYSNRDKEIAVSFAEALRKRGHELTFDVESVVAGDNWRELLMEGLRQADGLVVLMAESSLSSQFVLSEIGAARAFASGSRESFIIPVALDGIEIPPVIQDLYVVQGESNNLEPVAAEVDAAILSHAA